MKQAEVFHLRVRGLVISKDKKILLTRTRSNPYTYLPGGHVEPGEGLWTALVREFKEELGVRARLIRYLGVIEHQWKVSGVGHTEINHAYLMSYRGISPRKIPISKEASYSFFWALPSELDQLKLQPKSLRGLIRRWFRGNRSVWGVFR